ncbi:uncharacterized protein LOC143019609 isoform X2 [Oratosquilla oratoria]|uniref:uncharacterized protein LOC143019609 isoform X2 n=1 Tax=Oratosquilla oratoria TaxID=337810 RepID=UPI003F7759BF
MKMLVVLAFLVAVVTAEEAAVAKGTATNLALGATLGDVLAAVMTVVVIVLLLLAAIYVIYLIAEPVLLKGRSFEDSLFYGRSLMDEDGVFQRVLNSIDPVDSVFSFMEVEEEACRQRAVCELQSAASRYPLIGSFLRYLAPRFQSLDNYSDAIDVGSKRQDCTLVYAACPYSPLHGN